MKKINPMLFVFAVVLCLFGALVANAQRRDYLTEAEIELVRDAQAIDLRVIVLTKAIDRRISVIKNQPVKEKSEWGELPKGTRTELFIDIEKLLQKAIEDIDETAVRSRDSELFPKAVRKLAASCGEYTPQFKSFIDSATDEKQRGALLGSLEKCSDVIAASTKVPQEEKKKKN